MNIEKLVKEIIPPSDYHHRNGFNNIPLINKLNNNEKEQLEDALIYKLLFKSDQDVDTLVLETLAYLKSQKSLPILNNLLEICSDNMTKLVLSVSIFEINKDASMIDIAINIIRELDNKNNSYYIQNLTSAFYYLIKFKSTKINNIIEKYVNHKEYLISYNAKQVLNK